MSPRQTMLGAYQCQLTMKALRHWPRRSARSWLSLLRYFKRLMIIDALIHTIRKVKFLSKYSILTKPQHFHEFFTQIFLTIFLVKSKLSTAKKSKTTTFSRVFHPKFFLTIFLVKAKLSKAKKSPIPQHFRKFFIQKIDNFLGKSKLNFWTKNEDFEPCVQDKKMNT